MDWKNEDGEHEVIWDTLQGTKILPYQGTFDDFSFSRLMGYVIISWRKKSFQKNVKKERGVILK